MIGIVKVVSLYIIQCERLARDGSAVFCLRPYTAATGTEAVAKPLLTEKAKVVPNCGKIAKGEVVKTPHLF